MSTDISSDNAQEYAARIGLDWADQKHFWSMQTADNKVSRGELPNTPESVEVWAGGLAQRFGDRPVAIAVEQARGAVIAMLSKYAHIRLFPVHSTTLANYRKSFCPSGAKSDARDSDLILDLLIKHPERLRRIEPDTLETRRLQFLTEERRKLVDQCTAETQRLTGWLKKVFPQILCWFNNVTLPLVGEFLIRWPDLPKLQKASDKKLIQFFHQHNCRSEGVIQQRITGIRQAVPATHDQALLETSKMCILHSVRTIAHMRTGIAAFDQRIAEVYQSHPDRAIVESFPGLGEVLEPRLIAAVGSRRERFNSADSMASFTGIAPVTESSGKSRWVHQRWACPKFIRQTFHEWAGCSIPTCDWARQYYHQQMAKDKGHHAALRALAYKWTRIFFRCWRDGVPYDEQRYLESTRSRAAESVPPAKTKVQVVWKKCGDFNKPIAVTLLTE